jgi:hypothetical protein
MRALRAVAFVVVIGMPRGAAAQTVCGPGQVVVDSLGHCCSAWQAWDPEREACELAPEKATARESAPAGDRASPQWVLELRVAPSLAVSGNNAAFYQDAGLGMGAWVDSSHYLGALTSAALVTGADDTAPVFRVGAEGRYAFARSTASERINGGPSHAVPVRHWIGLALGPELVPGVSGGGWTALEYCLEIQASSFNIGIGLQAGLGVDTTPMFPGAASSYGTFGLVVPFGFRL